MKRMIVGVGLLALATSVAAAEITLYEHDNFRGRRAVADTYVNDLAHTGYNDFASSIVVRSGVWEACEDPNFQGHCMQLNPGEYPSIASMGLADRVASVREVGSAPERVVEALPPPTTLGRIVMYDGPNYTGRAVTIDRSVRNFANIGFDKRAQSAIVYDGDWELCGDSQFSGRCAVFHPGHYAYLGGGLAGDVSSARPAGHTVAVTDHPQVTFYTRPDFRGRSLSIDRSIVRDLAAYGFDNNASSLHVEQGYWLLCSGVDFDGQCRTFGPGDYASLPRELENHVSSARKISDDYPYSNRPSLGVR